MLIPLATSVSAFLYGDRVPVRVYAFIFLGDWWTKLVVVKEPCFHPTIMDPSIHGRWSPTKEVRSTVPAGI